MCITTESDKYDTASQLSAGKRGLIQQILTEKKNNNKKITYRSKGTNKSGNTQQSSNRKKPRSPLDLTDIRWYSIIRDQ